MSIRRTLLVAAVAACAFAALPSVASAYTAMYPGAGKFTVKNEGNTVLKSGGNEIVCTELTGSGQFANEHEGSVTLTFKHCKAQGTNCTGTLFKEGAGEIMTTELPFDIVKVTHPKGTAAGPGVLITPGPGNAKDGGSHFATFNCAFGLVHIEVGGNGVIGTITEPKPGKSASEFKLSFQENAETGHQTHTYANDTTGKVNPETEYHLTASVNGGETESATQIGNGAIVFSEGEGELTGE